MKYKNIIRIALVTAGLLLIPLIGRWPWNSFDFIVAGALIAGIGLMYELGVKRIKDTTHRMYLAAALVVGFLLVWAELAVGIFGTSLAGS